MSVSAHPEPSARIRPPPARASWIRRSNSRAAFRSSANPVGWGPDAVELSTSTRSSSTAEWVTCTFAHRPGPFLRIMAWPLFEDPALDGRLGAPPAHVERDPEPQRHRREDHVPEVRLDLD